jgi:hypothetical protein
LARHPETGELLFVGGGAAMLKDVRAVIRGGLIGGGEGIVDGETIEVGPMRAGELVEAYTFPARPMIEAVQLAWRILNAAIEGIDVKKNGEAPPESQPHSDAES